MLLAADERVEEVLPRLESAADERVEEVRLRLDGAKSVDHFDEFGGEPLLLDAILVVAHRDVVTIVAHLRERVRWLFRWEGEGWWCTWWWCMWSGDRRAPPPW